MTVKLIANAKDYLKAVTDAMNDPKNEEIMKLLRSGENVKLTITIKNAIEDDGILIDIHIENAVGLDMVSFEKSMDYL